MDCPAPAERGGERCQRRGAAIIRQAGCDEYVGGDAVQTGGAIRFARALIREKEPRLVFLDGTAERSAESVASERGSLDSSRFQERVVGIERIVPEISIHDAAEGVRTAPGEDLDVGPSRTAEGGVVERGLHLELLDALRRRYRERDGATAPHRVDIDPINLEVVLRHAGAVHRNGLRVPPDTSVVRKIGDGTRRHRQHLGHIARGQRQRRDRARVDDASELRAASSNEWRQCAHRH